jgi:uncharacterized protein (TIGR03067 family)
VLANKRPPRSDLLAQQEKGIPMFTPRWGKPAVLLVGCAGLLAVAPAGSQNAAGEAAERKSLEGTWEGWVLEGRGTRTDRGPVRLAKVVIQGDRISATDGKLDLGAGTFTLDLGQNPRRLDSVGTDGQPRGRNFLGIYTLEGDTLRWCAANPGKPRPTEFITKPAVQFYMFLKRTKA